MSGRVFMQTIGGKPVKVDDGYLKTVDGGELTKKSTVATEQAEPKTKEHFEFEPVTSEYVVAEVFFGDAGPCFSVFSDASKRAINETEGDLNKKTLNDRLVTVYIAYLDAQIKKFGLEKVITSSTYEKLKAAPYFTDRVSVVEELTFDQDTYLKPEHLKFIAEACGSRETALKIQILKCSTIKTEDLKPILDVKKITLIYEK